jgi:hypothetical protein
MVVMANAAPVSARKLVARYSADSPLGFSDMLTELSIYFESWNIATIPA